MEVTKLPSTNTTTSSNIPSSRASTQFVRSSNKKKKDVLFNLIDQTYDDDKDDDKERYNDTRQLKQLTQLKQQKQPSNTFVLFSILLITLVWFLITYFIWSFLMWFTSPV